VVLRQLVKTDGCLKSLDCPQTLIVWLQCAQADRHITALKAKSSPLQQFPTTAPQKKETSMPSMVQMLLLLICLCCCYLLAPIYFVIAIAPKGPPTKETSVLGSRQALWLDRLCSCCCCCLCPCYLLFTSNYSLFIRP
jgi:hypothetical protein